MTYFDTTELERGIIGAICQKPDLLPHLASLVSADDFISAPCANVFRFAETAKFFDSILAADHLTELGEKNSRQFISECIAFCPSTTQADTYAKTVRKAAEERTLRQGVREALDNPTDDLAADLAALCTKAIESRTDRRERSLCHIATSTYQRFFTPDEARIDTGFPGIDSLLKGLHGGELCIIGARPGGGKSAFGLMLAERAAQKGRKAMLFSLEMSGEELFERLLVRNTDVPLDALIDHKLSEPQTAAIAEAASNLSKLPLTLCDSSSMTVERIRADVLASPGTGLVVVDYIGLVSPEKRAAANRNTELAQISRDLKKLAMELQIPVVALSQLNREKESGERPTLRDLRDSGALEQDADKVLFLWRYNEQKRLVALSVEKNRRGRTGVTLLQFDGAHMRFSSTAEHYQAPTRSQRGGFLDGGA